MKLPEPLPLETVPLSSEAIAAEAIAPQMSSLSIQPENEQLEQSAEALERALELSEKCPPELLDDCPDAALEDISLKAEFQIFLSTFITIFLAEIGDKTQLTVLLMSAQSEAPWIVFAGAGLALIATSLCGVLLGKWLSTRVSPKMLDTSAGVLLLGIAGLLFWDVVH